jgi:hypothetical protein
MKTITAESKMGSQSAVKETIVEPLREFGL